MKADKLFFSVVLVTGCFKITNCCSQITRSASPAVYAIFTATTPINDISKSLLQIPEEKKSDMLKWNLTLYKDSKKSVPGSFKLVYVYGLSKQGSRGFRDGATTVELKGSCTISKGIKENDQAVVYNLIDEKSSLVLSFMQPDQNLLHLLDAGKNLMDGTGAWSYTLNRLNPVPSASVEFIPKNPPQYLKSDSAIVGSFVGRTPCNNDLRELQGISEDGCQIIKCKIILYQDLKTHEPSDFLLYTIYVGKGDTRYSSTGKWKITQGTATNPKAIVYQLDADKKKYFFILSKRRR